MIRLHYIGGPKDTATTGEVYALSPGQPAPLSIAQRDWEGRYKLREGQLVWVGK